MKVWTRCSRGSQKNFTGLICQPAKGSGSKINFGKNLKIRKNSKIFREIPKHEKNYIFGESAKKLTFFTSLEAAYWPIENSGEIFDLYGTSFTPWPTLV